MRTNGYGGGGSGVRGNGAHGKGAHGKGAHGKGAHGSGGNGDSVNGNGGSGGDGNGASGNGASGNGARVRTVAEPARRGFRERGLAWPVGIGVILGATVAGNLWVARLAGSDPSVQVEPDYYRKAVAWDARVAQERRNAALGWALEPTMAAEGGASRLVVRLTDRAGAPLAGATVTVSAFPVARSADVVTARLAADGDGYAARVPVGRTGIWELRFDVVRGADRFTTTRRIELAAAVPEPRA